MTKKPCQVFVNTIAPLYDVVDDGGNVLERGPSADVMRSLEMSHSAKCKRCAAYFAASEGAFNE